MHFGKLEAGAALARATLHECVVSCDRAYATVGKVSTTGRLAQNFTFTIFGAAVTLHMPYERSLGGGHVPAISLSLSKSD